MLTVTVAQLKAIAGGPAPLASKLVGPINRYAAENQITTKLRMAHFLAHMSHETTGFAAMVENLNYTTAKQLMKTWPSRFKTVAAATPYLRQPQKLANFVYGTRLGNRGGNDGWLYRGGGPFMLTGLDNYDRFGRAAGVDLVANPDLVRDPDTGVEVAAKYFAARMLKAADNDDIEASTEALNGGAIGLADRKVMLGRAKKALASADVATLVSEVPGELAEAEPAPAKVYDDAKTVTFVQTRLREIGYSEVGVADGKIGDFTRKAIVLYRGDKGLPYSDKVDDQLILSLATDTEKRKQPEGRADATPAEVRQRVPEAQATWTGKIAGYWTAGVSAAGAVLNGVWDNLGVAKAYLEPIKDFVGDVPIWVWLAAIGGGAFLLSRKLAKGEQSTIDAFREGARR